MSYAKGKVVSSGAGNWAKGGSGHMFPRQSAGPQEAGCTGHQTKGDGGKFAVGGKGHMFGKQSASTMPAGQTGKN